MAKRNIPVGLFYASYNSDCTYKLNSRFDLAQYVGVSTPVFFFRLRRTDLLPGQIMDSMEKRIEHLEKALAT